MADLRGVGRSLEDLLARVEGAADGSALPSIKDNELQKKPDEHQAAQGRKSAREFGESRFLSDLPGREEDAVAGEDGDSWSNRKVQREFKSFEAELLFTKEKALRLLGDMDRTKKELSDRLSRAGVGEKAIQKTMEYLARYGYVDDARYARHYFSRFCAERGVRRIRMELLNKGVDRETIEMILSENGQSDRADERKRCLALAKKRAAPQDFSNPKVRSRLFAYLARRGFREADIWAALREIETLFASGED